MASDVSDTRIQVHFDIHQPIELVEMTLAMQALAYEYQAFLSAKAAAEGKRADPNGVKLYITKIESNCILAELAGAVSLLGHLFAVMDYTVIFTDFINNLRAFFSYYAGVAKAKSVDPATVPYSKKQIDRFIEFTKLAAKNKDGRLGLKVLKLHEKSPLKETLLEVSFSSDEAHEAQKGALIAKHALESREAADYESVLMYFFQTNIDDPKSDGRTGDKAVIKRITEKPLPVYILNDLDKQKIRYVLDNPGANPLKLSFIVDVNVEVDRKEVPRAYRVVRLLEIIEADDDDHPKEG